MGAKEIIMLVAVLAGFVLVYHALKKYDKYTATRNLSTWNKMWLLYLIFICPVAGYAILSYKIK